MYPKKVVEIMLPHKTVPLHCKFMYKKDYSSTNVINIQMTNIYCCCTLYIQSVCMRYYLLMSSHAVCIGKMICRMPQYNTAEKKNEADWKRSKRGSKLPSTPESQFEGHLSFSSSSGLFVSVCSTELRFLPGFKGITRLEKGSDSLRTDVTQFTKSNTFTRDTKPSVPFLQGNQSFKTTTTIAITITVTITITRHFKIYNLLVNTVLKV